MTEERKTGTREWASKNVNICNGCIHNCRYCYARQMKVRFGLTTLEAWPHEEIDWSKVNQNYRKVKNLDPDVYDIMFPTTHDITPTTLKPSIIVLEKLLKAGNKVLIVSKPHMECISELVKELYPYKTQILFRFTITALDDKLLKYWEPQAPDFQERLMCLEHCFKNGFSSSISIEPCLDMPAVATLVNTLDPFVTETLWIGKMNQVKQRVRVENQQDVDAIKAIEEGQIDRIVLDIVEQLKGHTKVSWKDSIKEVVKNRLKAGGWEGGFRS